MEYRNNIDRRRNSAAYRFPFRDSDGELVREDRRKLPDRRLAGIEAELLEMAATTGYSK